MLNLKNLILFLLKNVISKLSLLYLNSINSNRKSFCLNFDLNEEILNASITYTTHLLRNLSDIWFVTRNPLIFLIQTVSEHTIS